MDALSFSEPRTSLGLSARAPGFALLGARHGRLRHAGWAAAPLSEREARGVTL